MTGADDTDEMPISALGPAPAGPPVPVWVAGAALAAGIIAGVSLFAAVVAPDPAPGPTWQPTATAARQAPPSVRRAVTPWRPPF